MSSTKAQISFEFTMSIVIGMLVVVALLAMFANKLHEVVNESQDEQMTTVLEMLADEVDFAKGAQEGYSRRFSLPMTVDTDSFSLNFTGTTIASSYLGRDFTKGFKYSVNTSICLESLNSTTQVFEVTRTSNEVIVNVCPDCEMDYYDCFYYDFNSLCGDLSSDEVLGCQEVYCLCD